MNYELIFITAIITVWYLFCGFGLSVIFGKNVFLNGKDFPKIFLVITWPIILPMAPFVGVDRND